MNYVKFDAAGRAIESAIGWNPGAGWLLVDAELAPAWEKLQLVNGLAVVVEPSEADQLAQALQAARDHAEGQLHQLTSLLRERIAKSTHYLQASRWPVQLAAAQDLLTNGAGAQALHTTMLALEARLRQRGETVEQLAQKVISNSSVFTLVGAAVDGIETATLDAISAAYINGDSPAAFAELTAQARETARTELLAIFTAALSETEALAIVGGLLGD
jgi:hypothetical protein